MILLTSASFHSSPRRVLVTGMLCASALLVSACGSMTGSKSAMTTMPMFSQVTLPAVVQVPMGHKVAMETVGVGILSYQCSAKKDMAGQHEWVVVGPDAILNDRSGKQVGKYFGPPATWESLDGSRLTATQIAVTPNGSGNIPTQLVKTNPAMGTGSMTGVSYIQRVNTIGGVAPMSACGMANMGNKEMVKYQADYIFYKPSSM